MIKKCYVLNGKIINIGEWDFQTQQIEIEPPKYDSQGNLIKEAVFEEQVLNPLAAMICRRVEDKAQLRVRAALLKL